MRTWQDPHPPTPSRAVGISIGVVAILVLTIIAILAVTTDRAGANNYPPTTPEVTIPECDQDECPEPTVPTIPTTIATTTTAGTACGLCAGQFSPTTTVAPATTAAPTTTVAPATSAVEALEPVVPPTVIPPVTTIFVEDTALGISDTLPVTGSSGGFIAVGLGACMLGAGLLIGSILWRRTP